MVEFYTSKEFAKILKVSERTLRRWVSEGSLAPVRLPSGSVRYTTEHCQAILGGEFSDRKGNGNPNFNKKEA